jgi:hypothetical protein
MEGKEMSLKFRTSSFSIELDEASGSVISIAAKQTFTASGPRLPLFSLRFCSSREKPQIITSDDLRFSFWTRQEPGELGQLTFIGSDTQRVSVKIRLSTGKSGEIHWLFKIDHSRDDLLESIEFPSFCVPGELVGNGGDGRLFSPTTEGVLIEDIRLREASWLAYQPVEYPNHGCCGYYPGNAQMQFFAFSRKEEVLYLAAHDPFHTTKELEFCPYGGGIRLIIRVFPGAIPAGSYELPYPMVMGILEGDWQTAATRYREWIESGEVHLPPKLTISQGQKWLEDSPVVVIYAVTGEGHHAGPTMPNEFFPFINGLPVIERLGQEFESRILTLLMHWEGTAPWSPPYVWPPKGGEDGLRRFSEELHAKNHLLGVYCSGLAWTNRSNTGDGGYNQEAKLQREGLLKYMCRGPTGEYECKVCNGESIRFGYDICAATEFAREVMSAEAVKIASVGVDYIQLFDQNLGGAAYQCYDTAHGHPGAPGPWQVRAMNSLIGEVLGRLKKAGYPEVILGCEAAAAECFISHLPLNDLRFNMGFYYGRPVPAYAFVFHEYTSNFMGNQVEASVVIDEKTSPHNLMLRMAYSFCAGDLLTVVLKNKGEIHWSWCTKWDVPPPPQEPLTEFIRHLNGWRKGMGKPFLLFGRMEKTVPFTGPQQLPLRLNSGSFETDLNYSTVLASRWISSDGRDAQFFVNYSNTEQAVQLDTIRYFKIYTDPDCIPSYKIWENGKIIIPGLRAILVEFYPVAGGKDRPE